jgi:Skp family chaperone for outer membrane proteins
LFTSERALASRKIRAWFGCLLLLSCVVFVSSAGAKSKHEEYGAGLNTSVPAPEPQLLQAVEDVVADGIIEGTKEYNKDEYLAGAQAATSTSAFPKWDGAGKVFYKIKKNALDPRNFKDTSDSGLLAVRYVVQHLDEKSAILKIDAVFVDDTHLATHPSNGSVEAAEFKDIQDHLAALELKKQEGVEREQHRQQEQAARELEQKQKQQALDAMIAQSPDESLAQHVDRLRHQVERAVKAPGTQLKSAPFQSATSLQSLPAGAHVAILISTAYWYGVETEDGQHGWIHRSQLEQLP